METEAEALVIAQCLEQIDALGAELGSATEAIVANTISGFENSIARQQELLGALAVSLPAARLAASVASPAQQVKASMAARLEAASRKICQLNGQYSALLMHTGRSMRMLQSVYALEPAAPGTVKVSGSNGGNSWSLRG